MLYYSRKLKQFSAKYGLLHASVAGIARKWPLVWTVLGPFVSRNYAKKYCAASGLKGLNLGSGSNLIPGMLNVDIDPRADSWVDLNRPLPFDNEVFDVIFSEEVLEHVGEREGASLLSECYRILKPGGIVHIATPDLDYFSSRISDGLDAAREMNAIFFEHGHRFIYSSIALRSALNKAGFNEIEFYGYQDPRAILGRLDSHADRFQHDPNISHYVEGTKPGSGASIEAFRN